MIVANGGGSERGTALVLVLCLVVLVGGIGAVLLVLSRTETLIAANFRQEREALYAAEGALGLAMRDLAATADWNTVLTGASASSFTDGAAIGTRTTPAGETIVLCCGSGSLTAAVQLRAHGGRSWDADTPQWQLYAWGPIRNWLAPGRIESPLFVAVWVADDPADADGNPAADNNGVVMLHAQALGVRGARRIVEAVVVRPSIGPVPAPAPGLRVLSWQEVRW